MDAEQAIPKSNTLSGLLVISVLLLVMTIGLHSYKQTGLVGKKGKVRKVGDLNQLELLN